MFKKKIKEGLKGYLDSASIDVFGLENKVTSNVSDYFIAKGRQHGIPTGELMVEIGLKDNNIHSALKTESTTLEQLSAAVLIDFFAGDGMSLVLGLRSLVEKRISDYLQELAITHGIPTVDINAKIRFSGEKVKVFLCSGENYYGLIPLKTLIKQFKP